MASWSENSSYQGAASGAATGTAILPGWGTAIGAAVGFVAGGLLGGSAKDAAKKAEEKRQREIEENIKRQNQSTYSAKLMAEQWALADIGTGREDTLMEATFERDQLAKEAGAAGNAYDRVLQQLSGAERESLKLNSEQEKLKAIMSGSGGTRGLKVNAGLNSQLLGRLGQDAKRLAHESAEASNKFAANEGIISSFENEQLKY